MQPVVKEEPVDEAPVADHIEARRGQAASAGESVVLYCLTGSPGLAASNPR